MSFYQTVTDGLCFSPTAPYAPQLGCEIHWGNITGWAPDREAARNRYRGLRPFPPEILREHAGHPNWSSPLPVVVAGLPSASRPSLEDMSREIDDLSPAGRYWERNLLTLALEAAWEEAQLPHIEADVSSEPPWRIVVAHPEMCIRDDIIDVLVASQESPRPFSHRCVLVPAGTTEELRSAVDDFSGRLIILFSPTLAPATLRSTDVEGRIVVCLPAIPSLAQLKLPSITEVHAILLGSPDATMTGLTATGGALAFYDLRNRSFEDFATDFWRTWANDTLVEALNDVSRMRETEALAPLARRLLLGSPFRPDEVRDGVARAIAPHLRSQTLELLSDKTAVDLPRTIFPPVPA